MLLENYFINGKAVVRQNAIEEFCQHAISQYPKECIGYIDGDGVYHKLQNISANPKLSASIRPNIMAGLLANDKISILCHSHPDGPDCPSEADMLSQIELDIPFAIVTTNGEACAKPFIWGEGLFDGRPIIGRPFRHGVNDCYDLLRALFLRSHDILLPQFARGWEWWLPNYEGSKNLYREGFSQAGFIEANKEFPLAGDVWLASIRSNEPNHAGVYLGNGLCIHHPSSGLAYDPTRISKREPITRWSPYITHWLRRKDIAKNSPSSWPIGEEIREKTSL